MQKAWKGNPPYGETGPAVTGPERASGCLGGLGRVEFLLGGQESVPDQDFDGVGR